VIIRTYFFCPVQFGFSEFSKIRTGKHFSEGGKPNDEKYAHLFGFAFNYLRAVRQEVNIKAGQKAPGIYPSLSLD